MSWETVLSRIEREAEGSRSLPIIGPHKGKVLDEAVRQASPSLALEVGVLVGYSTIRIARLLGNHARLISIEIDEAIAQEASTNLAAAGLADRVKLVVGDAKEIIPTLDGVFDLVFLDAAKDEYMTYLSLVEKKLHRGSVVVADNAGIHARQMKDYLKYVRSSGRYASTYYGDYDPYGDGVEVSRLL